VAGDAGGHIDDCSKPGVADGCHRLGCRTTDDAWLSCGFSGGAQLGSTTTGTCSSGSWKQLIYFVPLAIVACSKQVQLALARLLREEHHRSWVS